jgi:signal transduction histidine kinase
LDNDESIFRQIYQTQQPLAIPDVSQRPDWQQVATLPLARAWLGVPLIRSDEVIGMLSLTRETPAAYNEAEIALATAFAGQAAIALGNARLYDKLARFNQQMEYEVRKRTEAVQEAYDRLEQLDRTKTDFIRIASHELRTPLTVVHGYSQMLLKDQAIAENARYQKLVSGIQAGAVRLEEIVNSMVDVAKIDSRALQLYPEPVSPAALIQLVCDEFEKSLSERALTLKIEDLSELPAVEADPEALRKVFYHLIVNAIKYTPDGGFITITGRPLFTDGLELPRKGVEIVISDSGIGIDRDFHELIFTKFYQTGEVALHSSGKTTFKGGGPGLGLAIARGIAEAHRGKLWVESPGYDEEQCPGSHFHLVLPLSQNGRTP